MIWLENEYNFGGMACVLLYGESTFWSLCDFKELGVAKKTQATTSARWDGTRPWGTIIIKRTDARSRKLQQATAIFNRNCFPLPVK
jgi:hypothetical protein